MAFFYSRCGRACLIVLLLAGAVHAVSAQCGAPTPNPCFSSGGSAFICCAGSCGPFASHGDATCEGSPTPTLSLLEIVNATGGDPGPQPNTGSKFGDITYFTSPITDLSGNQLGHSNGLCIYIVPQPDFEQQCQFSIYFDTGDSLNFEGRFLTTPTDLGITSGTGKYVGASGYTASSFVSNNGGIFTYRYDIFII